MKAKFEHTMDIIRTEYVLNTKFVKHLENTDLYEMRVSVNFNEYRTILFAVDNDNIILSKRILLLNGFLKKSTKDYSKQIKVAKQILEDFAGAGCVSRGARRGGDGAGVKAGCKDHRRQ